MKTKTVDNIREAFDTSLWEHQPSAFHFTEAVAATVDKAHALASPLVMKECFGAMWEAYFGLYASEHDHALQTVLGPHYEDFSQHDDTEALTRQIMHRIYSEHGGYLKPGGPLDIDVSDILKAAGIT